MPNYGLVIDSTYNPISYEQYAAPFIQYAEVYNKIADQYDALEMEANKWEKLAQSEKDQQAYKKYQDYVAELRRAADDLAENGLSTKTRGILSHLKSKYASDIQPMEDAYTYIQEKIKAQEQIKAKNPRVVFDNNFSTDVGITDVLNNPYMSYNYIDLDTVEEDAMKAAAAQSSRNINITNNPLLGTAYKMQIQGYALPDIVSYIQNFSQEYPEIYELYNNLKTKYGSYGQQVDDSIILGMLQGYTATASPIQVSSITAPNSPGGSGMYSDDISPITEYITVQNDAGDTKRIALDSFTNQYNIDEGYYPLDENNRIVKNADGTPANAGDPRVKKNVLKQVQTDNNHYMIITEDGMPLKQNGRVVGYDNSKQYFDTKDWTVKDNPQTKEISSNIAEPVQLTIDKEGTQSSSKILDFSITKDRTELGVPVSKLTELKGIKLPQGITLENCDIYIKQGKKKGKTITIIPRKESKIVEKQVGY